jgi:magnesium-transporting ATPase (P-type)
MANVKRNGKWKRIPARELVRGDLISIKLGDVIPADAILIVG